MEDVNYGDGIISMLHVRLVLLEQVCTESCLTFFCSMYLNTNTNILIETI